MLKITIPETEFFDEKDGTFHYVKEQTLQLEHSLISLSKWESKWCTPFLSKEPHTGEQIIDYIRFMTINVVDPYIYYGIDQKMLKQITDYIDAPMTATTFREDGNRKTNREIVTAEIIYYWMISLNIPFECQKWHLNRLLTLIRVCNIKNAPAKKMSARERNKSNASLNEQRKRNLNTRG